MGHEALHNLQAQHALILHDCIDFSIKVLQYKVTSLIRTLCTKTTCEIFNIFNQDTLCGPKGVRNRKVHISMDGSFIFLL